MILSTIHAAKGQEWKAVFVLNAVDGCIPSDMATGNAIETTVLKNVLSVPLEAVTTIENVPYVFTRRGGRIVRIEPEIEDGRVVHVRALLRIRRMR